MEVDPNIKITARQIRFLLDRRRAWAVLTLRGETGMPKQLQGFYRVPLDEQRRYAWARLENPRVEQILQEWVASGFKLAA